MRIISAKDYGDRVVLRVCGNPGEPEWIHVVGDLVRDIDGGLLRSEDGQVKLQTSSDVPLGETGENCHNCRYNWDVEEIVFEGAALYRPGVDGGQVRYTDEELSAEAFARVAEPGASRVISALEGLDG